MTDLSYQVPVKKKQPKVILDKVSAIFQNKRMTALMGPSGSGKTTLLDVCAIRKTSGTTTGTIKFGTSEAKKDAIKEAVGYVEQFDTLVGELTVTEMLMYTAELRLPTSLTKAEKMARVNEVIEILSLGSCADTLIGNQLRRGISGGQCKRVNIALALITKPSVIFLDEPTSGLDSSMANDVASTLKGLTKRGRTIVCTIHSPTAVAFAEFDDLIMLKAGKVVYGGPLMQAVDFFTEACNLAKPEAGDARFSLPEWLVDCISNDHKDVDLAKIYEDSPMRKQVGGQIEASHASGGELSASGAKSGKMPGPLKQLFTLLQYRMTTHYKSGEFLGPRIGDKVLAGLIIMTVYWGIGDKEDAQSISSVAALLYFISALCGYGAAAFVPSLTLDRPLFYREMADGCYSAPVYMLSKFLEEAILCVLTSTIFSLLVFFGVNLQGNFFVFWLVYYVTTMIGIVLAYAIASSVPTMEAANALLPTYVTLCMYFGGFFIIFDKINDGWLWFSWTSFLRYSWGAQMLNQFQDNRLGELPFVFEGGASADCTGLSKSYNVLEFYGLGEEGEVMGSLAACLLLQVLLCALFAACGACAITFLRFDQR